MKRKGKVILIIAIFIALIFTMIFSATYYSTFTEYKWKTFTSEKKFALALDIVKRDLLDDMSKEEVLELLGKDESESEEVVAYLIGSYETLLIYFDEHNIVRNYFISN